MTHEEKVAQVVKQVRAVRDAGQKVKIEKATVSHFVPNPYEKRKGMPKVDIKTLNEILLIDKERRICVAEPAVSFFDLVNETMKQGMIPLCVPELKGITIGGAISGCSIESMSYKHGGFHDSALEYEMVTGTGDVMICSPANNADLFHMIHGSYGTLGVLTKITFRLMPAKSYVKMKYVTFRDFDSFWVFLRERCEQDDYHFVDAIIHDPKKFVVCLGTMVSHPPYTSKYDWLDIFYKSTLVRDEDYLAISDYFFRYDTECHWLTKTVPLLETRPVRFLFGKFLLGSTNLIKWSNRLKGVMKLKRRPDVVVDVFIPSGKFGDFYKWYQNEYQFYPLWIVPYKAPVVYPWINKEYASKMKGEFFIDCAVYGKKNGERDVDYSEVLERKTVEFGGIKTLISRNHFDERTFWKIYNKENYDCIKQRIDPNNIFSNLYTKMNAAQ